MKSVVNIVLVAVFASLVASCGKGGGETSNRNGNDMSSMSASKRLNDELKDVGVERFTASEYKPGIVRHIVLFRYKDTVSAEKRQEITKRFMALQKSQRNGMPYIVSIEEGAQSSGEKADQGLQQAFLVTFHSEGDRNFYVGKPVVNDANHYDLNHQVFKDFVGPLLAPQGVLVFDYSVAEIVPGT